MRLVCIHVYSPVPRLSLSSLFSISHPPPPLNTESIFVQHIILKEADKYLSLSLSVDLDGWKERVTTEQQAAPTNSTVDENDSSGDSDSEGEEPVAMGTSTSMFLLIKTH